MSRTKVHLGLFVVIVLAAPLPTSADEELATRAHADERVTARPSGDAVVAFRLAVELEAKGHSDLARVAYGRVVAADPEHLAARRALGFERVGGVWLAGDDLRRAKGFVRIGREWVLAQEVRAPDPNLSRIRRAATGLRSGRSVDRIAAAQEIGRIGDERGIEILVDAWTQAAPRALDGYFARVEQRSYVKDFDVDVA